MSAWIGWAGDLRLAARSLRRAPGYAATAVTILALGLGAAAGIFSVFDAISARALPFAEADRLVRVYAMPATRTPRLSPHAATVVALAAHAAEIGGLAGQRYSNLTLAGPSGPERVVGIGVTPNWAKTLGLRPLLGRVFTPSEEREGRASGVALLSFGAWQSRYGGDPAVVGRVLPLSDGAVTIVGVLPRGLSFPYQAELWFPLDPERDAHGPWGFNLIARRGPGVGLEQLNEKLKAWTPEIAAATGSDLDGLTLVAVPLREVLAEGEQERVVALLAGVGFLLAIICANVAGLVLSRAGERQHEAAVRTALGAGLKQRLRPAFAEALLLAASASGLGFLIACSARSWLSPLLPGSLKTVLGELPFDARTVGFVLAVGALVAMVCGIAPIVLLARVDPARLLVAVGRGGTTSHSRRRSARALVAAELALALALSFAAVSSFEQLQQRAGTPLGYESKGLVTLTAELAGASYERPEARSRFLTSLIERFESLPGVIAAGGTSVFPSPRGNTLAELEVEGAEPRSPGETLLVNHRLVSPGFLTALRVPLLEGRRLSETDHADGEPVVVVSRSLAQRYFPGESAVGHRVRNLRETGPTRWLTIVGVVGDVQEFDDVADTWYLPFDQNGAARAASEVTFAVRSSMPLASLVPALRTAAAELDGGLPLFDVATPRELQAEDLVAQRTATRLSALFCLIGLGVSSLGIYALMALDVLRRRREIGIRIALGGEPTQLAWSLFTQGARLVALGLVGGAGVLLAASRLSRGVVPAPTIAAMPAAVVAVVLILVAGLAGCLLPTLRTARTDPAEALRSTD